MIRRAGGDEDDDERPAELDRIVAHLCAVEDAVAERTEPLPWGTAVFHSRMPIVRETNMVRVETHAPDLSAAEVADAVERRFADRDYRNVEVLDEATGAALAPGLEAAGFRTSRHLLMGLERDPPPAAAPVEEVEPDAVLPLRAESIRAGAGRRRGARGRAAGVGARARAGDAGARLLRARDGRPPGLHVPPHGHAPRHRGGERLHDARPAPPRPRPRRRGPRGGRGPGAAARSCSPPRAARAQHLYGRLGFRRSGLVHRFVRAAA